MSDFSPQSLAAARLFRTVMTAMARPGRMLDLAPCPEAEGACLPASLAIIATLCDYQTPVYLGQGLDAGAVQQRIRFETGAPLTREPGEAAMALVTAGTLREAMIHFARGTHEYPDRSTTVVVQLPVEGTGTAVELQGPGLERPIKVSLPGLDAGFWQARAAVNASYPLGLDFIFVAGSRIVACPRSTQARLLELA